MVMVIEACYLDGSGSANAMRMTHAQWIALQDSYRVGELVMPCCSAPAIPKLSANGRPFFAHAGGSCSTSEESLWHMTAKTLIRSALEDLGCNASEEKAGEHGTNRWQADVWAERGPVKLAVEIQRSYQSLRAYRDRQEKYSAAGVQALWLLRADRYLTLTKSMGKERLRTEFGGKFPAAGHFGPCLSDIPVARLELDPEPAISGAGFFSSTVSGLLDAVLAGRFRCVDGLWCIDNLDTMHQAAQISRARAAGRISTS
ncbi:competence protein CoiA [Pectobacterium betavasculorum]|uniref:competence protein CoiA n=1 Tax=Pectobacterium betavasculorum TaxID=55207 RepID=UPI003CC7A886